MNQLTRQLRRWQSREAACRFAWGFARWAGVVAAGVTACCAIDWTIDRYRDTPFALRVFLTALQLGVYAAAAVWLLVRLRVPGIDVLAGRAEVAIPEFGHRLVTALQLNRPGAKTQGMSQDLIAAVTREAESMSARHDLAKLTETDRLGKAAALLVPLVLFLGGFVAVRPTLVKALLARQCLIDVDIPRSVALANETPKLWPAGDEVVIRVSAKGRFADDAVGVVRVSPDGQVSDEYPLTLESRTGEESAMFAAKLPPSSVPFTFRARLNDGRLRSPASVAFDARPVVKDVNAWLILPAYVDPAGKKRFERFQPQGEVTALPDCGLRVEITASKPVAAGTVVVLARDEKGTEFEAKKVPMTADAERTTLAAAFDLPVRPSGYRVEVIDDNTFANLNPPRRGIGTAADDPPRVNLLAEVLKDPREPGPLDDYEVTGMPLVLGGQVQIGYAARSPLGLRKADIVYRVNEGDWIRLPLTPTVADLGKLGKFVPELGVFENSGPFGQVEFYQLPPTDAEAEPVGIEAGGRYSFQTGRLKKKTPGGEAKLEVGDRVEFYVDVFDRNPAPGRPGGKSESRFKVVVTQAQLEDWTRQRDQSRERLKQLEDRQRGVFKPAGG